MAEFANLDVSEFVNTILKKKIKLPTFYQVEQYINNYHSAYIIDIINAAPANAVELSLGSYLAKYRVYNLLDDYINARLAKIFSGVNIRKDDTIYATQIRDGVKYQIYRIVVILVDNLFSPISLPLWENNAIVESVRLRSPTDYIPDITKRSKLGGLTNEQIFLSPFCHLKHFTEFESLETILSQGGLKHRLLLGAEGLAARTGGAGSYGVSNVEVSAKNQRQFPGSYFYIQSQRALLNQTKINELDVEKVELNLVDMIFSLALLQQRNWHLNITDNYGKINNITFSPTTLPRLLNKLPTLYGRTDCHLGFCREELIIHDKVSIDFCEGLVVANEEYKIKVQNLLQKYALNIPVYIKSDTFLKSLVNVQFVKHLDDYDRLDPSPPSYCYTNNVGATPYGYEGYDPYVSEEDDEYGGVRQFDGINPYTLEGVESTEEDEEYLWNKMLANCGIDDTYTPEREEELYQKIEAKMDEIYFGDKIRPEVKDYPPFKYTPDYY